VAERSILISGSGIAGPALAHWLNTFGWSTTVVERLDELREGGQNIDVRGAAREVARRMGIEEEIRAASTGEVGTQFVDADGEPIASFPVSASESGGATAELEILRGQLSRITVDRTRDDTEYILGDEIVAVDDRVDGVTVTFAHGASRTFDGLAPAEGLRSCTRSLVFPDSDTVRELGLYTAYLTIARTEADTNWWRWHNPGRGDHDPAPHLRRGRLADAAHCSSPTSGMSTSLAITGAYLPAGELAAAPDHRAAFDRYEAVMRPYVDKAQQLPPGVPRLAQPRTRAGLAVLNTALKVAASPPSANSAASRARCWPRLPTRWTCLPTRPRRTRRDRRDRACGQSDREDGGVVLNAVGQLGQQLFEVVGDLSCCGRRVSFTESQ
jgi:2-polyprenyl-6-methoxyphenol hydroxylase-like FAD-dependent oxidoreductase